MCCHLDGGEDFGTSPFSAAVEQAIRLTAENDATPITVQRLINNDWQSMLCEKFCGVMLQTKDSELPQPHKRWRRSANAFAVRPAAQA